MVCADGAASGFQELESTLVTRMEAPGCDHDAVFGDAYLTIMRALIDATGTPGCYDRPEPIKPRGDDLRAHIRRHDLIRCRSSI